MALPKISLEIDANPNSAVRGLGQVTKALQKADAATSQYEKDLETLERAMKSGMLTDVKYANSLAEIEREYRDAGTAAAAMGGGVARFTKATKNATAAANLNSYSTRMMAMQFSQVGQQTMVTGDFVQALAIQLPDLALGFGTVGIAGGVLAGFLMQTLIPIFSQASEEIDDFADRLDEVKSIAAKLAVPLEILEMTLEETTKEFGEGARRAREWALAQAEIRIGIAQSNLKEHLMFLKDITNVYISLQRMGSGKVSLLDPSVDEDRIYRLSKAMREFMEKHKLSVEQAQELSNAFEALNNATDFEAQQNELQLLFDLLKEFGVPLTKLPKDLASAVDEMIILQQETDRAKALMSQLQGVAAGVTIPPVTKGDEDEDDGDGDEDDGGGVGGRDPFAGRLKRLQKSLMTEREVVESWLAESEQILDEARHRELIGEIEHKDQMLRLEKEYQERLGRIKEDERTSNLQTVLGSGHETLQALGAFNQKALKMAQAFGAAKAFIATYEGAAEALKQPFPLNLAAASSIISAGLGFVAAIKSVSSSGSIGAGGGGGAMAASGGATTTPAASRNVAIQLTGDVFSRDQVSGLINEIMSEMNEQVEGGAILRLV